MANKGRLGIKVDLKPNVDPKQLQTAINQAAKQLDDLNLNLGTGLAKDFKKAMKQALIELKGIKVEVAPDLANNFKANIQKELDTMGLINIRVNPIVDKSFLKKVKEQIERIPAKSYGIRVGKQALESNAPAVPVVPKRKKINDFVGMDVATATSDRDRIKKANAEAAAVKLRGDVAKILEENPNLKDDSVYRKMFQQIFDDLKSGKIILEEARERVAKLHYALHELGKDAIPIGASLKKMFLDHMGIQATLIALNLLRQSVIKAGQNIVQLDTAMTELKKVTDVSREAYIQFLDRATQKAQTLGSSVSDVVTATADFARLGYGLKEAEELAQAAMVYKNVGDGIEDVSVASQSIISTMKAFKIDATDAMSIVDKFNKTGNEFAISSAGVGEALSRSAAGLAETNNSLSESIALITAANTVVQNPEVVGNALKTLSLRITKTSTELEELGEDTSFAFETTSQYRQEVLAITSAYGKAVDIMDEATGGYKSTYSILSDLAEVWDDIDDRGKQSLLYTLGGARQVNVLSAILKNFDDARAVVASLEDSSGSAMRENEKYLDSITGKWNQVQATFQAISDTLIDNELVKGVLDIVNALLKGADAAMKFTGGLTGIAAGFGIQALYNGNSPFIYGKGAGGLVDLLKPYGKEKDGGTQKLSNIFTHLKYGSKGVYSTDASTLRNAMLGVGSDVIEQSDSVDEIISKLTELGEVSDVTKAKLTEAITADISQNGRTTIKTIGDVADGLDLVANKAQQAKVMLANIGKAVLWAAALTAAFSAISYIIDESVTTIEERQDIIDENTDKIGKAKNELAELQELQANGVDISDADKNRLSYLQNYIDLLTEANRLQQEQINKEELLAEKWFGTNDFDKAESIIDNTNNLSERESIGNITLAAAKELSVLNSNGVDDEGLSAKISTGYGQLIDSLAVLKSYEKQLDAAKSISKNQNDINNYQKRLNIVQDTIAKIEGQIDEILATGVLPSGQNYTNHETQYNKRDTWNQFDNYSGKEVYNEETNEWETLVFNLDNAADSAENLKLILNDVRNTPLADLNTEIDSMQSAIKVLATAHQEYADAGAYTLDTWQELTQLDGRYLDLLIDEEGQIRLNAEGVRDLAVARIEEMRVKILGKGIETIQSLTNEAAAKKIVEQATLNNVTALREETAAKMENAAADMLRLGITNGFSETQQQAIDIVIGRTNALMKAIDVSSVYADKTKAASNATKDLNDKLNDDLRDRGNILLKALDNRKKPLQDQIKGIDDKKKALQGELDKLNEIYEAEDKAFQLQKLKDAYERAKANKTVRLYTHDKGWQWVADPTEVKKAEDAYKEYQKEMERDEARKVIEDQIEALEAARDAVQAQIDAIDELKNRVQEAMEGIGLTQEEHMLQTQLMAEFESMTYGQLALSVNDYANSVVASYNKAAQAVANYNKVKNEGLTSASQVEEVKSKPVHKFTVGSDGKYEFDVYHSGGLVRGVSANANVSSAFKTYMDKLERNEVPSILESGEYVLTERHQRAILKDTAAKSRHISSGTTTLNIGDIIIKNPVGNVSDLSEAIVRQLPNQIMKDLYK